MPAEIGEGAAGFTNVVTKSGTNRMHGSAFEFVRHAALGARSYFDHTSDIDPRRIPPFVRNEFGVTNGGPVVLPRVYDGRDKTFYFVEYQGFRQVLGTTQVFAVPTAAERQGIDTTTLPGDTLMVPVNPAIASLLARYPLLNDPTGSFGARTYAASSKVVTDVNQFPIRLDQVNSSKAALFARFSYNQVSGPTTNPDQTAIDPSFGVNFFDHQRCAALRYSRTVNPRLSFTVSIGFIRSTPFFPATNHIDPSLVYGDGLYQGFDTADGSIFGSDGDLYQIRWDTSYVRGTHNFKWGLDIRANRDTTIFGRVVARKASPKSAAKNSASKTDRKRVATKSAGGRTKVTQIPQSLEKAATQAGIFLYTNDAGSLRYFDPNDLHSPERKLFG